MIRQELVDHSSSSALEMNCSVTSPRDGRGSRCGPRALPVIGNLLQMPKNHEWKTFAEWAKTYGDCVYVHILGQPIILLNSLSVAHDLLNQRSAIYSSRPRLVMAGELIGFAQAVGLMPYSPRFLSLRRLMHKELNGSMLQRYWPLHEEESRLLVEKAVQDPSLLQESIRHYAGSVILRVTYGYRTAPQNDKFLLLAEKVMAAFSLASQPGAWAVDILPRWPQSLPFFLAMALYPEVQSAAQAEVDRVVTAGRLPQLSDRPNLPYVECVMREVLRWNPVAPLGLPHLLNNDGIYGDYHLTAGSIVMANVWSILQDPAVFPDPRQFRPERFMNDKRALDVATCIFGFGRRSCPGVHFAEASMFIAIATALSQCTIFNPTNSRGEAISRYSNIEYRTGTISHPPKYRCDINPRTMLNF
ncbi:cytochrome P450 [Mycena maculata]|uniref:Cytochrome P450 n=1 Tax=Mycena maculata TaxID=230809 RepID=A0AAD7IR48_9AGAR|nr:cytochrome P450 [Mycena maculata]